VLRTSTPPPRQLATTRRSAEASWCSALHTIPMQRRYIFKKTLDTRRWSLRVLAMFLLASIGILLTGQLSATPPAAFPLKFKVSASRMSSTPPAVTSSTNRIQRFSRFWRERRVARENKVSVKYAMSVNFLRVALTNRKGILQ